MAGVDRSGCGRDDMRAGAASDGEEEAGDEDAGDPGVNGFNGQYAEAMRTQE